MQSDLNIPEFGYKTHISIDAEHGFIRRQKTTDAAAHDGARLREGLVDPTNTASVVWADTAYRSAANEAYLADHGKRSQIHRKSRKASRCPSGRPRRTRRNPRSGLASSMSSHTKRSHEPLHPHGQYCPSRGDDHDVQYRLQSRPMAMVGDPNCVRLMGKFEESAPKQRDMSPKSTNQQLKVARTAENPDLHRSISRQSEVSRC